MNRIFALARHFVPFFKYCAVGLVGTALDVGVLYLLIERGGWTLLPATSLAFAAAVVNNYVLNKVWTFGHRSKNDRKLFIKFLIVSCVGLVLTNALMFLFVELGGAWYVTAKLVTSAVVLIWNFLANKYWTFRLQEYEIEIPEQFAFQFSIVVPAYNEEKRIGATLDTIARHLREKKIDAEIIVADDGSTDGTRDVVGRMCADIPNLSMVHYRRNMGKGFAVRQGVRASRGKYILFTDADNSTPIQELERVAAAVVEGRCDIAIGSRYAKHANVTVSQPPLRVAIGRLGNALIRLFLITGIRDTQCGFKLFSHHAAKEIFARQKITRWGFDMEALVVAGALGYKIAEVPVSWHDVAGSRLRPIRDGLRTFWELIYIKLNLWSGRYK